MNYPTQPSQSLRYNTVLPPIDPSIRSVCWSLFLWSIQFKGGLRIRHGVLLRHRQQWVRFMRQIGQEGHAQLVGHPSLQKRGRVVSQTRIMIVSTVSHGLLSLIYCMLHIVLIVWPSAVMFRGFGVYALSHPFATISRSLLSPFDPGKKLTQPKAARVLTLKNHFLKILPFSESRFSPFFGILVF